MGVVLNTANPTSFLNKNKVALEYIFYRKHVANNVVEVKKVGIYHNYADPMTKILNSLIFFSL